MKLSDRRAVTRLALNRVELALSIGVSTTTVDVMVAEGALPQPRIWHTRKLWLVSEVEAYLSEWPSAGEPKVETRSALDEWRATKSSDHRQSLSSPGKELQEHYNQLGFDPNTMDGSDYSRMYKEAVERWRQSVPSLSLNKRERDALMKMANFKTNALLRWDELRIGIGTADRLEARGYLIVQYRPDDRSRATGVIMTEAGLDAARLLAKHNG